MGVLRKEEAAALSRVDFGEPRTGEPGEARAMVFEDLTPRPPPPPPPPEPVVELPPPPPPMPSLPPEPPPPPVFEVPEELVRALYEDAVVRGLEDGKAQVLAELQVLQERYASALEQLDQVSRQLVDRNRITLISLACKIAERLVRHHISTHPDHLLQLVREAITEIEEKDEVVVHCSPQDHAYLTSRRAELAHGMGDAFRVQVVADEALEYGDFRVETRSGAADGRVATRLQEAHDALMGLGD